MWIEMKKIGRKPSECAKSCHVCGMWIEIATAFNATCACSSHATYVACGLKSTISRRSTNAPMLSCHVCGMWIEMSLSGRIMILSLRHATYVACGLKLLGQRTRKSGARHATYVACGLKCCNAAAAPSAPMVMPRMWHVD